MQQPRKWYSKCPECPEDNAVPLAKVSAVPAMPVLAF